MPAVFISYSRRDNSFVGRLHDALCAREYDVWVDWQRISPSGTWLEEVRRGIAGTDAFIYVISPDSMASETCRLEVEYAVTLQKRIVPLVRRDSDSAMVLHELGSQDWVFMREADDFGVGIERLMSAIETA